MKCFFTLFLGFIFSISAFAESFEFKLKSKDGLTQISGQIDKPDCEGEAFPAVMIVGGTGLFYRNGFFGRSGTDRDFLFSDLAKRLNSSCLAVIRFDYRGISCDLKGKDSIQKCVDQKLRALVTDETTLDDIQTVYDHGIQQAFVDSKKIVLMGHSEGSLNISRLVARDSVHPAAIMFFGGLTESAYGILHWQIALRPVEWAFEMDTNKDAWLSADEIKKGYKNSKLNDVFPKEDFLNDSNGWSKQSLTEAFEIKYNEYKKMFLAIADKDPYMTSGIVYSSMKWWKRWFVDDVSVLENLKNFTGPIEYHNGDIDSQTPALRELEFLQSSNIHMQSRPKFILHPGKGHGLSSDTLYGPIDESIADEMVRSVTQWLKQTRSTKNNSLRL